MVGVVGSSPIAPTKKLNKINQSLFGLSLTPFWPGLFSFFAVQRLHLPFLKFQSFITPEITESCGYLVQSSWSMK